jgi:hypothetical protein
VAKVIVVPADDRQPARVEEVTFPPGAGWAPLRQLLGGYVEPCRYDRDCWLAVDEDGGMRQLPENRRAGAYVREQSEAARQHGQLAMAGYRLLGTVIVLGGDPDHPADVPARMLDHFNLKGA